jgi:ABC-2 type transport system permease protein
VTPAAAVVLDRPGHAVRAAGTDLRDAIHAEWTKLRTLTGTYWLLVAVAALTIAVGAATAAAFSCPPSACTLAQTGADPARISLTGIDVGEAVVAVLAVLAVSNEYSTGMIRVTLTAMPRRLTVLCAKAAVLAGCVLAAGVVGVLGSVLAGRLILPGRGMTAANGYQPLSLANGADLRACVGSVLYLMLIALFALGLATAVRESAVAIGAALALLYLFPLASAIIGDQVWSRRLEQIGLMPAGLDIQTTTNVRSLPLTPWQGLGVTALWAVGALLLGGLVLRFRDA